MFYHVPGTRLSEIDRHDMTSESPIPISGLSHGVLSHGDDKTIKRRSKPHGNPITKHKIVVEPMSATDRLVVDAREQLLAAAPLERQALDEAIQLAGETLTSVDEMATVTLRHKLTALYSDYLYSLTRELNESLLHDYTDDAYEIIISEDGKDNGVCSSQVLTLHTSIRHLIGEATSQLSPFSQSTDDYLTEASKLSTFTTNLQQALVALTASLDKHTRLGASVRRTGRHDDAPLDPESDRFAFGLNAALQQLQSRYAFIFAERPIGFRGGLMTLTGKEIVITEEESDDDAVVVIEKKKKKKKMPDKYIEEVERLIGEQRKAGTRLARGHIHYVLSARDIKKEVIDVLNEYEQDERDELEAYGDPMIRYMIDLITVMSQLNAESDTFNTVSLDHYYNEALRVFQFTLHDPASGGTTYLYDMINVAYERLVEIATAQGEEDEEEEYERYARFLFDLVVTNREATEDREKWDPLVGTRKELTFDESDARLRYVDAAASLLEAYRQAREEFRAFGEPREDAGTRPLVKGREPTVADMTLLLNRRPRLKTIYSYRAIAELERRKLKDKRAREKAAKRHEKEARVYRNLMRSTDKLVLGMLAKARVYYRIALLLSRLLVEAGALPASYSLHSQWPYLVNKGHTLESDDDDDDESSSSSSDDEDDEESIVIENEDSGEEI